MNTATILLVEDEPLIAELYRSVLEAQHYTVTIASNKQAALQKIQETVPQLILLDLMIPIGGGEDLITYDHPVGFDILEWVKHHPECSQTKVMVLTNLDSNEHQSLAERLGAVAYLVKSNLEPHDIVRHVDAVVAGDEKG